jgi:hypothetical protein
LHVTGGNAGPPRLRGDSPVSNRSSGQDVELLTRVRPDFVCRGWFKWHHTPDWQTYAPLARACAAKDIRLQGGITLSAIYPGENGIDDATFRDFVSYCADGQPVHCSFPANVGTSHSTTHWSTP